jgi:DnaJ homolog subfamily C member 9
VVNTGSIEKFKKEYQGSEEEQLAVIEAYVNGEGDMERIYEEVMLSDPLEDEDRFRKWIDAEIEARRVEAYPAYVKETKTARKGRMSRAKAERKEAEEYAKELGLHDKLFGNGESSKKSKKGEDDMDGLKALIQQRQKERSKDFLADLEAKFAPKKNKKKRKSGERLEEPPEEAFERTAKRVKKSKRGEAVDEPAEEVVERKSKQTKRAKA